jgi:hypothetical protein
MNLEKSTRKMFKGLGGLWRRLSTEGKIALVIVTVILVSPVLQSDVVPYVGGWEITKQIDSVKVNGVWYDSNNLPAEIQTGAWGTNTVRFDVDEPNQGLPDIQVYTSSPREYVVNARGEWVEASGTDVFEKGLPKTIGDNVYFFDHHVFRQQVRVTAYCDANDQYVVPIYGRHGEARGMVTAIDAQITVRVKDTCLPWANWLEPEFDGETGSYLFENGWAAIMSMRVAESEAWYEGYTPPSANNPEGTAPLTTGGAFFAASTTGDINMWLSSFSAAPLVQGGLPSEVSFDVTGGLSPAFKEDTFFVIFPTGVGFYPVYFNYVIETHVLTVANYALESGDMDDDFEDIDYFDYVLTSFGAGLEDINAWLASIAPGLTLATVLIVIVVLLFVVWFLKRTFRRKEQIIGGIPIGY